MSMERVQMLLEPQQRRKLAELARARGTSVAEITRQAIDAGLEQLIQNNMQNQARSALEAGQLLREKMRKRARKPLDVDIVEDIRLMREEHDDELIRRSRR